MPEAEAGYAVHPRSQVNRLRKRAHYNFNFIHNVIDSATVLHVAFPPALNDNADPFPAMLPMIGCTGLYDPNGTAEADGARDLYLHGYVSSRLMRLSTATQDDEGLPVTVSGALVDGLVLSLTPNSHSYNYRSAVVHGYAVPVTDTDEKLWAMARVTDSVVDGRWAGTRTPPTPTEMKSTQILRVRVVTASGKERKGQPHDDKHDMNNEEVKARVWTGVVPVWEMRGDAMNAVGETKKAPEYVQRHVDGENARRKAEALEAAKEPDT